jgi:uncharacterized protein
LIVQLIKPRSAGFYFGNDVWLICKNEAMKLGSPHISIKTSAFGHGVFAEEAIAGGTVICAIEGNRISFADTLRLKEKESYALQIDTDFYILCEPPFVFTNHSCQPNTGINHQLQLIALRDIPAGEELLWDYSTSMLERHWTMNCQCKSVHCRKIITDFDLLNEEVQEKYIQQQIVLPFIVQQLQEPQKKSA